MDAAHLLRAARRHVALDQRSFAKAAGVPPGTLASWESGRRQPSVAVLERALQRVGLALDLTGSLADPSPGLVDHLRRSLTCRLKLACNEPPAVAPAQPRGPAWRSLVTLSRHHRVQLAGDLAIAMWVPLGAVQDLNVLVHRPRQPVPSFDEVSVAVVDQPLPSFVVPVTLAGSRRVWVAPPEELLLGAQDTGLRQADRLLHEQRGRDDGGRRPPAHKDPDEWHESWRVLQRQGITRLTPADRAQSRAWRLDAPVSLAQLLREGGTLPW